MNKILKYILLLAIACFAGKVSAQELKSEVSHFSTSITRDWKK